MASEICAFGAARAEHQLRVFSPFPAQLRSVHVVGPVNSGNTFVELDQPMLAARYGGPISTSKQTQDLVPTSAVFHVLVHLEDAPPACAKPADTCKWRASAAARSRVC